VKTPAERKRDERQRMRTAGFVLRQLWVHPQDWEAVRRYVEQKRRKRTADEAAVGLDSNRLLVSNGSKVRRTATSSKEPSMNTNDTIIAARRNLGGSMESSARLCLADAISLFDAGNEEAAKARAIDSLRFSVGIFHADYQKAAG
jgi:hypothetical protein